MNSPPEIKQLAWERLAEAEILYQNNKFDGAFYLAGYSVELMLKYKICVNLGVPNLFNTQDSATNAIHSVGELRKTLKTHNLFFLLLMGGLKVKYDSEKAVNKNLVKANSLLFGNWDESCRYRPCGYMKSTDVKSLIDLLKDSTGLLTWIENS